MYNQACHASLIVQKRWCPNLNLNQDTKYYHGSSYVRQSVWSVTYCLSHNIDDYFFSDSFFFVVHNKVGAIACEIKIVMQPWLYKNGDVLIYNFNQDKKIPLVVVIPYKVYDLQYIA